MAVLATFGAVIRVLSAVCALLTVGGDFAYPNRLFVGWTALMLSQRRLTEASNRNRAR